MKKICAWVFLLVFIKLINIVRGEFLILSGPPRYSKALSLYTNQQFKDMYCITDELDSALTWNSNLDWIEPKFVDMNKVDKPFVLYKNDVGYLEKSNFTCQMNNKSSCSDKWTRLGAWNFISSLTKPVSPVNDNRWEDFKEEKMSEQFKGVSVIPNIGSFAVSIRGPMDAHFALCNEDNISSFCFYIILGGWKNTKSVIRMCRNGIPEPATKIPSGDCLKVITFINGEVLSTLEWRMFLITWDFETQLSLSVYDTNKKLLHYSQPREDINFTGYRKTLIENPKYFLFVRSPMNMLMKFHFYDYLYTFATQSKLISPEIMSFDKNMCIEMSISLCKKCFITIDFIDSNGKRKAVETVQNKIANNLYNLPSWQTVKVNITLSEGIQQPVKLEINTLLGNAIHKNNSYWAVANIRRCYDGALKFVKINAYQDYNASTYFWPVVKCQKISGTGVSTVIDSVNHRETSLNTEKRSLCVDGNIGSSCSVTCSKFFEKNMNCQKLLACDKHGCFCGQGFTMLSQCSESCPASKYGYECKQKCGNCTDELCSFTTGECKFGCNNNENKLFIPPYCKTGISSPRAPGVDLINSTCVRLYLDVEKEYKLLPTSVHFEILTNLTNPPFYAVFKSEHINIQKTTINIQTYVDGLSPGNRYRSLALLQTQNQTFRGKITNFTTPCTESVALNFVTSSNENSITLNNLVDANVNDSCPYTWYRVQFFSEQGKLFDGSTPFPKKFTELESFSHFKIIVYSERTTIINKVINTLEGAPTPVKNVTILSSFVDKISLWWQPPEKSNGKIVNYTVEIQLVESRGCSDLEKSSHNLSSTESCNRCSMKAMITNTLETNFNYTFYGLKPYGRYLITIYACTLRHLGEKTIILHETTSIENPTEVFINLRLTNETSSAIAGYLRWDAPNDCSTITGPILAFKLLFKKLDFNFTVVRTNSYYYPLEKSIFNGAQTYEVFLYALRDIYTSENKTAYTRIKFTMFPRAPPPVHNAEIIEVDIIDKSITLKWNKPVIPTHGELDYYSLVFCNKKLKDCNKTKYIANLNDFCKFHNIKDAVCTTVPLPFFHYDEIQIRAHNKNVTETSEYVGVPVRRIEFTPSAPMDLTLSVIYEKNYTIKISWSHPSKCGGKIDKFLIKARVVLSTLKVQLWNERNIFFEIYESQTNYSLNLELFPSSIFIIEIRAVTIGGLIGNPVEGKIDLPNFINFNTMDLQPRINDDLTVSIKIPEVQYDIKGSTMVLIVQGPKYCDYGFSYNKDLTLFMNSQITSYYKVFWKAAIITNPELYANKEFKIGDSTVYDGLKNYALCSNKSYIIHLVLFEDSKTFTDKNYIVLGRNILKAIKTDAIHLGEQSKNNAIWMIPVLFFILIVMTSMIILYRKNRFARNNTKVCQQDSMPLTNDISTHITNNLVEKAEKDINSKHIKDLSNNNVLIIDPKQEFTMPVKVQDFEEYVESVYKSGEIVKEYLSIKSGAINPCTYGSQSEVKSKNRYANLFPYDKTRVILEKLSDDPYSDYINANFITGFEGREKAYIATQGPKPNTVIDFWRMIWQENVKIICMMTNTVENEKVKCEQYWPFSIGKKVLYGKVSVEFVSEEIHSNYTYRNLQILYENQEIRSIKHLHYTTWPDHGVPSIPSSIVIFLNEIQKHSPAPRDRDDPPIVVHCSAGVGRTGTLIVLDMSICRAFSENVIDVHANVQSIRKERLNMVDNTEQYLLVHLVLIEYLNSKNTCFICDNTLPKRIAEAKKDSLHQFKRILDTNWQNEILSSSSLFEKLLSNKNGTKYKTSECAGSFSRLYLKKPVIIDEYNDCITATNTNGIFKNCEYITTKLPIQSTFADFWRMLSEGNIELVIVLQLPNLNDSSYCELVPENQAFGNIKYMKVIRQENSTIDCQYYFKEEVLIIDSSEKLKEKFIKIISYKNWPESSLPSPSELVKFWKILEEFPKTSESSVVIVCRDGVTASGIWLAMSFLLKRMSVDKICDVTQAVKAVKTIRNDFLNQSEYLEYLYDVALVWSTENSIL